MPHLKAESTWEAPPRDGRVDAAKLTLPPAPTSASKSTQRRLQSGRTGQAASQEGSQPGNGQDSRWEGMPIPLLTPVQGKGVNIWLSPTDVLTGSSC